MNKKYILYGLGNSNIAVKKFFDQRRINYQIYNDHNDHFTDLKISHDTIVIKSPGIKNTTKFMKYLLENKIKILTDIGLFYEFFPNYYYIGITGTLGKTTTTLLCYKILKDEFSDVYVGGNIGVPIFELVDQKINILILELSSFELEYAGSFKPNVIVYLNIYHHHLNHHSSFNEYVNAKFNPLVNMNNDDVIICNQQITPYLKNRKLKSKIFTYSISQNTDCKVISIKNKIISFNNNNYQLPEIDYLKIEYQLENFLSIFILFNLLKIDNKKIFRKIIEFNNPQYRMEIIYNQNNIIVINDSKSTCLKSTIEALKNIKRIYHKYFIHLIIGGKLDKQEIEEYKSEFITSIKVDKLYFYGENRIILKELVNGQTFLSLEELIESLPISNTCRQLILFSPGAQSFDQFVSFEERGKRFNELMIKKLN